MNTDLDLWEQEMGDWGLPAPVPADLCVHVQPTVGCAACCPCAVCKNRSANA